MKRLCIVGLIMILLFTGCSKNTETIRFGTMPTYSAAIYAVGIEEGFFEEAGAQVELTVFRSARDRDGAATAGQLDGFMTDIMGAINLNAKGFPFLMTSREYDDFGVVAGPGVDLESLTKPRVGISEHTVVEYIVDSYLKVDAEKISIVSVPDRMGALMAGELDFGVFPQPFMGIVLNNGGQVVLTTAEEDFHPVTVVFEEAFIRENEEAVKAFYEGYAMTVAFMQANSYDVYKEHLVTYGLATDGTVDFYDLPVDSYGLSAVALKDFEAITTWMLDKGLLEEAMTYDRLVNKSFVK